MKKIGILMVATFLLTGCGVQAVDLTAQEQNIIANYAAHVVLQHDKNYNWTLEEPVEETEGQTDGNATQSKETSLGQTVSTGDVSTQDAATLDANSQGAATTDATAQVNVLPEVPAATDIASLLKLDGFAITYDGFLYDKQYKDTSAEDGATVNSLENKQLMILKFSIENTTDETKLCDILSLSPQISVSINGGEAIPSYESLINYDITTLSNEIDAHQSIDALLLVEVGKEVENNITSLSLDITVDGATTNVPLQ